MEASACVESSNSPQKSSEISERTTYRSSPASSDTLSNSEAVDFSIYSSMAEHQHPSEIGGGEMDEMLDEFHPFGVASHKKGGRSVRGEGVETSGDLSSDLLMSAPSRGQESQSGSIVGRNSMDDLTEGRDSHNNNSSSTKKQSPIIEPLNSQHLTESSPSSIQSTPDCPVKCYVLAVGRMINKSESDLHPVLVRLISQNWLEEIRHLQGLSDVDWDRLEIPRQLMRLLRHHLDNWESILECGGISRVPSKNRSADTVVAQIAATHVSGSGYPPMGQGPMGQGQGPLGQGQMGQGQMGQGPMGQGGMGQGPLGQYSREMLDQRESAAEPNKPAVWAEYQRRSDPISPSYPKQEQQSGTSFEGFPGSSAVEGNEVEKFIRRVCLQHGRSQAELTAAVQW